MAKAVACLLYTSTKANISDNSNNNQNDNNNSNSYDDKPSSGTDKKDVTAPKTGDNTPSVWLFILLIRCV